MTFKGFPRILASLFLLLAATTMMVHLTDAFTSTSAFEACDDLFEACFDDTVCEECWTLPVTAGDDYDDCVFNFNVTAAGDCGLWAITPCCAQEEAGCLSNDNYNAYSDCFLDVISDGNCTTSSYVCPESSSGTADGSTGTADGTNGARRISSQLRAVTSAMAGAVAGVAMATFCMVSALCV